MKAKAPIKGMWAKRAGGHMGRDGILTIKGKRGGPNGSSNSGGGKRSIEAQLVENAIALGWKNGVRIRSAKR